MDLLFEFIVDLLFDFGMEIISSNKISKRIRIPILIFLILLFLFIILGLILLGVLIFDESKLASLLIISLGIVLFVGCSLKFKKIYYEKFKEKDRSSL